MKILRYKTVATVLAVMFALCALNAKAEITTPAGLRYAIAVVENNLDSLTANTIDDYSLSLYKNGKRQESRLLSQMTRRGFGSGFVVEHKGELLLLTNSHVVGIGTTADILFINGTDTLRFDKSECVYQDDHADIAILRLPDSAREQLRPLEINTANLSEGTNIFTAGYPGLAGIPSWQFGQGIISNANLLLPEMPHPYIQHTGQIDRGSSGSPLLLQTDNGYEAIGINTLKAHGREAVGMAVPADMLLDALENLGLNNLQPHLQVLNSLPVAAYEKLLKKMPEDILQRQEKLFEQGYVVEGLALIATYADSISAGSVSKAGKQGTAGKPSNQKQNVAKKAGKSGIEKDLDYVQSLYLAANFLFPTSDVPSFYGLGYNYYVANYLRLGGELQLATLKNASGGTNFGANISFLIGGQVPIAVGDKMKIIPYLTPDVGICIIGNEKPYLNVGGKLGTDIGIDLKNVLLFIGVEYDLQYLHQFDFFSSSAPADNLLGNGIGVHIGFAL